MSERRPSLTREQVQAAFGAMMHARDHFFREARPLTDVEVYIVKALQHSMDDIESALWTMDETKPPHMVSPSEGGEGR